MASENISRRTLAKGAAWSVPVIAASAAAPAFAASRTIVGGTVCRLYYGATSSTNFEVHTINLGVTSNDGTIPAGTEFTWTVSFDNSTTQAPTLSYSPSNLWTLTTSQPGGQVVASGSFTVTLTVNRDATPSDIGCGPGLVWNETFRIRSGTTVTVTTAATGDDILRGNPATLRYTLGKQFGTVSSLSRRPHRYLDKSGGQVCFPEVHYKIIAATTWSNCGDITDAMNNTSTIYPDGSCAFYQSRSGQSGDTSIPEKC